MDCIPQSAKSSCRIGTSDEREAVQLEAIYARTAWIVELEASRRDGAIDPFPLRATGRHPRRHDGSVLFGPRLGRGLIIREATNISLTARGWFGVPDIYTNQQIEG